MASPSLWLYRVVLRLALPLALPALAMRDRVRGKRRTPLTERLGRSLPPVAPDGIWIQAVSVGEVEVARALVGALERSVSPPVALLTATTAAGLALARRTLGGRLPVAPCPLDLRRPLGRVLESVRPRLVVLVETELWPELIHQADRRRIPVAVVNGRISDQAFARYLRVRGLLGPLLAPLRLVLARTAEDGARFVGLGIPAQRVVVAGNLKYDVEPDPRPLEWEGALAGLALGRPVVVAGSTIDGEEELLLDALDRLRSAESGVLLVLAPRHPERFDGVAALLERRRLAFHRRSRGLPAEGSLQVVLLDTIGELARAYRFGQAAFVGGSLVATGGGHNPLEPALWGVPVLSGQAVQNFREIYDELEAAGGARIVAGVDQLAETIDQWLANPLAARSAGAAARAVVERNRGATNRTVDALIGLMNKER